MRITKKNKTSHIQLYMFEHIFLLAYKKYDLLRIEAKIFYKFNYKCAGSIVKLTCGGKIAPADCAIISIHSILRTEQDQTGIKKKPLLFA